MNTPCTILNSTERKADCLASCGNVHCFTTKPVFQKRCGICVGSPLHKTKFALYPIGPTTKKLAYDIQNSLSLSLMTSGTSFGFQTLQTASEKNVSLMRWAGLGQSSDTRTQINAQLNVLGAFY